MPAVTGDSGAGPARLCLSAALPAGGPRLRVRATAHQGLQAAVMQIVSAACVVRHGRGVPQSR
jgi:hypothetical protein